MTAVHQRAREASMPIECKKDSLRQNQDGTWKLVLTIAPDGLPDEIMRAMPGTRYQTAFVEIGDDEQPAAKAPPAPPEKVRRPFHDLPLSQQAGIRCGDGGFARFLENTGRLGVGFETTPAAFVRSTCCGGESRSFLDSREDYADEWRDLNAEYEQWAGLAAEDRS